MIHAFSDALSVLSSSTQTNNSTKLTSVYVNLAIGALLEEQQQVQALTLSSFPGNFFDLKVPDKQMPLESSLKTALKTARQKAKLALAAGESANREMNRARAELSQAEAALKTWEAALAAAEAAVGGKLT